MTDAIRIPRPSVYAALLLSLIFLIALGPASAARAQQPTQGTPLPDQTVSALQTAVATQQVAINTLTQDLAAAKRDSTLLREEVKLDVERQIFEMTRNFAVASAFLALAGSLLAFFGLKSYRELKTLYYDTMRKTLQENLYQLDATFLPIYIPVEGFERELERIKLSGLRNIQTYRSLGKGTCSGVVITRTANEHEEQIWVSFIEKYKPKPEQAAYILYSPGQVYKLDSKTYQAYNNMTAATNPTALARAILDVGRGLQPVSEPPDAASGS
jgi:hypothetical protein